MAFFLGTDTQKCVRLVSNAFLRVIKTRIFADHFSDASFSDQFVSGRALRYLVVSRQFLGQGKLIKNLEYFEAEPPMEIVGQDLLIQ